jgi:hypothetical protein
MQKWFLECDVLVVRFFNLNFGGKKLAGKKLAGKNWREKNWREKIGGKSFKAKFKKP